MAILAFEAEEFRLTLQLGGASNCSVRVPVMEEGSDDAKEPFGAPRPPHRKWLKSTSLATETVAMNHLREKPCSVIRSFLGTAVPHTLRVSDPRQVVVVIGLRDLVVRVDHGDDVLARGF